MEAILLAGLGKEEHKGELKFRVSPLLNSSEELHQAFRIAKSLYVLSRHYYI